MIRALWLRYLLHCLRRQEEGLLAERAGIEYMLRKNADDQSRARSALAMAELQRRYRVAP